MFKNKTVFNGTFDFSPNSVPDILQAFVSIVLEDPNIENKIRPRANLPVLPYT